jgi:hypothetical protein
VTPSDSWRSRSGPVRTRPGTRPPRARIQARIQARIRVRIRRKTGRRARLCALSWCSSDRRHRDGRGGLGAAPSREGPEACGRVPRMAPIVRRLHGHGSVRSAPDATIFPTCGLPTAQEGGRGRCTRPGRGRLVPADRGAGHRPRTELDSYLTYAMSTIVDRALPDVRDGLKPQSAPHPVGPQRAEGAAGPQAHQVPQRSSAK